MCRVEDSGKAVDGFFVLGASGRLPRASIIAMLFLLLKCLRGLATFSLFHILVAANLLLSVGKTNGWIQYRALSVLTLNENMHIEKCFHK